MPWSSANSMITPGDSVSFASRIKPWPAWYGTFAATQVASVSKAFGSISMNGSLFGMSLEPA